MTVNQPLAVLLDFDMTKHDPENTPYRRIKKAWESFIMFFPGLQKSYEIPDPLAERAEAWVNLLAHIQRSSRSAWTLSSSMR